MTGEAGMGRVTEATGAALATGGTGDVLLAYENEAILATQNGEEFDWIVPPTTLLIENPGAVLVICAKSLERPAAVPCR